jgi:hypothetical protein
LDLEVRCGAVRTWGNLPLVEADPDVHAIMEREKERQVRGIETLGSQLTNKYSRGAPGGLRHRAAFNRRRLLPGDQCKPTFVVGSFV